MKSLTIPVVRAIPLAALLGFFLAQSGWGQEPDPAATLKYLAGRKQQQLQSAKTNQVLTAFQFVDRAPESGIRFEHHIVDDAGKTYKAAHYDHGNGMAVADIDGDGALDIYFTTQLGRNQLWRNLGAAKFEEITEIAGVALKDQISVSASFADIDNDGLPDLFVTTVRHGNHLFKNLGHGKFSDITKEAGVDYNGHSSGAVFFDFDNDGWLDLFLTNVGVYTTNEQGAGGYYLAKEDAFSGHLFPERTEYSLLYRNLGKGRFQEVSKSVNLRDGSWSGDATFADLNEDGFPDLYVVNMEGDNHFYQNEAGKSFIDRTAACFPKTPWGAMGLKFFDYNNDGRFDLFVTDMHSDMTRQQTELALGWRSQVEKRKSEAFCSAQWTEEYLQGSSNNIFGNAFYENRGGGKFVEVSERLNVETYWPWGMSVGDLNADGFEDIFVTAGMGYPFRYAINSVLMNEAGLRFVDAEFLVGVEPRRGGRISREAFVLDCSGPDKTNKLCEGRSGLLPVAGALSSRSSAIFDLDGDGDLDIVTLDLNDRPQILLSNLAETRQVRYLKIKLRGVASNRDGLGATVTVQAEGSTWSRYVDGKSGYLAQSSLPLYFGLGAVEKVDHVAVKWPSGRRQTLPGPKPNSTLEIEETKN